MKSTNNTSRQLSAWHWLTLDRLVTIIVFTAIFAMAIRFPLDTDGWWHLRSGRWIVENGAIPRVDPFSHTRLGAPWIDHSWLAQLLIYAVYAAGGFGALTVLVAFLVTIAFAFVWLQCREGERWLRAFVFFVAAVASGIIWSARPQMISFVLAAVVAFLLYSFKHGRRRIIWGLPLVMLLWANVHGGFAIGFILIVAYLFGEVGNLLLGAGSAEDVEAQQLGWGGLRQLIIVAILSFLALALNPNGAQMWLYPLRTVGIGILQDFIAEWQPPDFHQLYLHPFIWLLLAALTAFGLAGRRADFTDLTLVAVFTYLSLLAVRNVPLFALVLAPIIVHYGTTAIWRLERWKGVAWPISRERPASGSRLALNWLLLCLILLASGLYAMQGVQAAGPESANPEDLPAAAVDYLQEQQPPGPIFNNYNWGGYLIWRVPEYPVYVDGRTDLFDDALLRRYLSIYLAERGWREQLDQDAINLVLAEPASPLARELVQDAGWETLYHDAIAIVLARR